MKPRHNWFTFLLLSEACAFTFAVIFVIVLQLSLPPTDGAYGRTLFAAPLVLPTMSTIAALAGLLVWPFMYFALRYRPLRHCLPIVVGMTVLWIVAVTPLRVRTGILGSFAALGAALLLCRRLIPTSQPPGHCQKCGYNLTGNVSGVCPECGRTIAGTIRPEKRA